MLKFIYNENIYMSLPDLLDKYQVPEEVFAKCITGIPTAGPAVSEADVNRLLQSGVLPIEKNDGILELTKVETLEAKVKADRAFQPLKYMVLAGLGENKEAVVDRIERETKEEIRKETAHLSAMDGLKETIENKRREAEETIGSAEESLKKADLELQCITELHDGRIGFMYFLAGKDVFYSLYGDDVQEIFDTIERKPCGIISFYAPEEVDLQIIEPEETGRDFRDYLPLENLGWCLENEEIENEFTNYINCSHNGICFDIKLALAMKYINSGAFPEYQYINGIPEIHGTEIINTSI